MGYMDLNKKARADNRVDRLIEATARQAAALLEIHAKIDAIPRPAPVPPPAEVDLSPVIAKIPDVAPLQKATDFLSEEITRLRLRIRTLETATPPPPVNVPTVIKHVYTKSPYIPHLSVAVAVNFSLLIYILFSGRF